MIREIQLTNSLAGTFCSRHTNILIQDKVIPVHNLLLIVWVDSSLLLCVQLLFGSWWSQHRCLRCRLRPSSLPSLSKAAFWNPLCPTLWWLVTFFLPLVFRIPSIHGYYSLQKVDKHIRDWFANHFKLKFPLDLGSVYWDCNILILTCYLRQDCRDLWSM